jgi:hypothetical protein
MIVNKLVALNKPRLADHLRGLIPDLLSAEVMGGVTNAAMDLTFDEVVEVFGLITPSRFKWNRTT